MTEGIQPAHMYGGLQQSRAFFHFPQESNRARHRFRDHNVVAAAAVVVRVVEGRCRRKISTFRVAQDVTLLLFLRQRLSLNVLRGPRNGAKQMSKRYTINKASRKMHAAS